MSELNADQQKALITLNTWWRDNVSTHVLQGKGGTGKTFFVNYLLEKLPGCTPLLLAPTHEALKQLRDKTRGDYTFATIAKSLGIAPTTHEKDMKFIQHKLPQIWEEHNLAVIDEASQIDDWVLELLMEIGIKILFIGHKSQLSPVKLNRSRFDKCLSPVFERGFPTTTLNIPQRNLGSLWNFCNLLDDMIYSEERNVPKDFDILTKDLKAYLASPEAIEGFYNGSTKCIMWTNNEVNHYNTMIRVQLFGEVAKKIKYIPGDKILLAEPVINIDTLDICKEAQLKKLQNDEELSTLYANTKGEITKVEETVVNLNSRLIFQCWKLTLLLEENYEVVIFEPKEQHVMQAIADYYEHKAWEFSDRKARENAYKLRRFILSCFAKPLHSYAATTYRMQGSTINNVILIESDIRKSDNIIEQKKHLYTAASRAKDNLMYFRGKLL